MINDFWPEYYKAFSYFSESLVREGCHPRKMVHGCGSERAIVLVHGLTDSPWFMQFLANHFYHQLGYDVYMPLLHMHGLREPNLMRGVSLKQWQENVRFSVQTAATQSRYVAIGGLSTGGALSLWARLTDPLVNGSLYLFSAAIGLCNAWKVIPGKLKEAVLRLPGVACFDSGTPLIGPNPYRYRRIPLNSAVELAGLIAGNRALVRAYHQRQQLLPRIFAAWTEADKVISVKELKRFTESAGEDRCRSFVVTGKYKLRHACVVLGQPVYAAHDRPAGPPLERANPLFTEMLAAIDLFAGR